MYKKNFKTIVILSYYLYYLLFFFYSSPYLYIYIYLDIYIIIVMMNYQCFLVTILNIILSLAYEKQIFLIKQ